MKKHKRMRAAGSGTGSILLGILYSFAFLIVLALLASIFLAGAKSPTKNLGAVSLAVFLIGALASGFVNSKRGGEGGFVRSLITALAFTLLLLVISLIAAGGKISGMHFMNCACYMLVAAFAAFLGRKNPRKRRRH